MIIAHLQSLSALALCVAVSLAGVPASAEDLVAYDGFAYSGRLEGGAGGTGWNGPWFEGHNAIAAESLASKLGETPAVTGGRMVIANPDWPSQRTLSTPIGTQPGTWFVSFLASNDAETVPEHYAVLSIGSGDQGFGFGKSWMLGTWALLLPKEIPSQVSCATKDAVFVVLKVTYATEKGASKVQAFFDPELVNEPRIADIEMTGIDLPPGERVRIVGKKAASFDELRIGTTWASVCPTK
jgi:hypothetical protein